MKKKKSLYFLQPYFFLLLPLSEILKNQPEVQLLDVFFICLLLGCFIFLVHSFISKAIRDEERAALALSVLSLSWLLSECFDISKSTIWIIGSFCCLLLLFVPLNLKLKSFFARSFIFPLSILLIYNASLIIAIKQQPTKEFFEFIHLKSARHKNRATFANEEHKILI